MRKMLYRGKTINKNHWTYGYYVYIDTVECTAHFILMDYLSYIHNSFIEEEVKAETVGQFTGEYDINHKEIFEHDIVRKTVNGNELIGVVEYSDGAFGVRFADGSGELLCFFEGCCEVIGNIHDNPELINKGE